MIYGHSASTPRSGSDSNDDATLDDPSDSSYRTEESESDDDDYNSDEVSDATEDDPTEIKDADDVPPSSVGNWRNITSSQRAFLCTAKEKLNIKSQSSDNKIFPLDVYSVFITDE